MWFGMGSVLVCERAARANHEQYCGDDQRKRHEDQDRGVALPLWLCMCLCLSVCFQLLLAQY